MSVYLSVLCLPDVQEQKARGAAWRSGSEIKKVIRKTLLDRSTTYKQASSQSVNVDMLLGLQ